MYKNYETKMKPVITIITPTYNHQDYIRQCIDSVRAQTYPYWEQVIIDDGSTDNTADIIKEYDDERIIYLKQENQGIYQLKKLYNRVLGLSNGDYIAILEGDDYWPEYKLERQMETLENHDVVLCCGNAEMVNKEGKLERMIRLDSIPQNLTANKTLDRLLLNNFITACTVICEKRALLGIGGFQQPSNIPFVDYPTWLALSRFGDFYFDDTVLGYWRHHRGQITTKNAFKMLKSQWETSINFYNNLSQKEREELKTDLDDIIKSKNRDLYDLNFLLGRKCLHNKDWAKSREFFTESLKGSHIIKFYSAMAIIGSFFKIDLERYISMVKRSHIDDLIE